MELTFFYTPKRNPSCAYASNEVDREVDAMAPQAERNEVARILEAAGEDEVLREQLEYLIEHNAERVECGCSECQRYLRVRSILLEIFGEPHRPQMQEIPRLARAA